MVVLGKLGMTARVCLLTTTYEEKLWSAGSTSAESRAPTVTDTPLIIHEFSPEGELFNSMQTKMTLLLSPLTKNLSCGFVSGDRVVANKFMCMNHIHAVTLAV